MSTANIVVGLSISEPDEHELVQLGLSEIHVRHAFIEISRHLLARGSALAYGGDLRAAGYTEALFDLVRTYDLVGVPGPDRIFSYLAWPLWQNVTAAQRAELANIVTLKEIPPPAGAPPNLPAIPDQRPSDLLWYSLALTAMRVQMNSEISARIVLGGRTYGQQGLYPGVAEEAALALRTGLPLYVIGGFGGCGRLVASALTGAKPIELSIDYQLRHTSRYAELLGAADSAGQNLSFSDMRDTFNKVSPEGLNNGLTVFENYRLFATDDVDEAIVLILRGLQYIAA